MTTDHSGSNEPRPTDRIRFRRYHRDDSAAVEEMFADAQARRFYPDMANTAAAQRWIDWNLENYANLGFGLWVIQRRRDGRFLGDCGLTMQPVEGQSVLEVGYHLQAEHRGSGYATEAGRSCIDYAFEVLKATLVCSIVDPANGPSNVTASRLHASQRTFTNERGDTMNLYWTEPS